MLSSMPSKVHRLLYKVLIIFCLFISNSLAFGLNDKVLVKATKVISTELFDIYDAVGQCKNDNSRDYYAATSGTVDILSVKQGDKVKAGEIVIGIDSKVAKALKEQSEAALKLAQTSHIRNTTLFAKKFISEEDFEKSRVALEGAKLKLEQDLKTYDNMVITAPFDGVIGVLNIRIGDQVKPDSYLFSILSVSKDKEDQSIFIELPENLQGIVVNNVGAIINNSSNKATGLVTAISPYLSDSGIMTAKVSILNSQPFLHSSYVNVRLILNKHKGLAVPQPAVLQNDNGYFIYQIDANNTVKQLYVKLGSRTGEMVEIKSDTLHEGDQIVLEGLTKVQDGAVVEMEQAEDTSKAPRKSDELSKSGVPNLEVAKV